MDLGALGKLAVRGTISINIELLDKWNVTNKEFYFVLSDEIEKKRIELVKKFPDRVTQGLLQTLASNIYQSMPWYEIFSIASDVFDNVVEKTGIDRIKVLEHILELNPENWSVIFWMLQYEKMVLDNAILRMGLKYNNFNQKNDQGTLDERARVRKELKREIRRDIASGGGKGKAKKSELCRIEFLRMVDVNMPPWEKTKEGLAEAVLKLKPLIVEYAKKHQNSAIRGDTNKPNEWLREHWKLEKRAYKKTPSK